MFWQRVPAHQHRFPGYDLGCGVKALALGKWRFDSGNCYASTVPRNYITHEALLRHLHNIQNMAPAGRAVVVLALSLLYLCGPIISTEYFSTLSLFNGELNERGCGPSSEWEEYSPDCGEFSKHGVATSSELAARRRLLASTSHPHSHKPRPLRLRACLVIYLYIHWFIHLYIDLVYLFIYLQKAAL